MKCQEIREQMPDLAAGFDAPSPETNQHLVSCADCAAQFAEFRRTMELMDEWKVPEPSPYFDVRLRARLREEAAKTVSWWQWIRKPALAISLALLMVMSVTLFRTDGGRPYPIATEEPGTAVSDLQALEKNNELYSDFDLLDDLQVQQDVNANP